MTPAPFRWALRGALAQIAHVTPVPPRAATGAVADVYAAAEREFGLLAPPLALHSPDTGLLVAAWTLLRETLLVTRDVPRAVKEAVAAGVSLGNSCPYCVEVHGAVLGGLHGRADARAVAADRLEDIADPALRAVAVWARDGGPAPAPERQAAELLGVALAFHYLNRMVHVFLGPSPLPPSLPRAAGGAAAAVLGRLLAPTALRTVAPGPAGEVPPLPGDLGWAGPVPDLAAPLAVVAARVDEAGARVLAAPVRNAVHAALNADPGGADPGGADPGGAEPGGAGLGGAAPLGASAVPGVRAGVLSALPAAERAAGRLALLTALAPYRVDDATVSAFRAGRGARADADLVAATAWASLTAARDRTRRLAA
jgi:AhpD family alkylhydroperoxidase